MKCAPREGCIEHAKVTVGGGKIGVIILVHMIKNETFFFSDVVVLHQLVLSNT